MKRTKIIMACLIVLMLVLAGARVVVANTISTNGIALGEIQNKNSYYLRENMLLKEKVLTLSSLSNIASKAAVLGFVPVDHSISLNSPIPLALKQ